MSERGVNRNDCPLKIIFSLGLINKNSGNRRFVFHSLFSIHNLEKEKLEKTCSVPAGNREVKTKLNALVTK